MSSPFSEHMRALFLVCLMLSVPSFAPAQSAADAAIDRAVDAYARVRTARATFEQTIRNSLTGSTVASRGEFEQLRPDKFVFRFSEPKGDVIVSDGKYVWLYLPSSTPKQVVRAPLRDEIEGSIDLIGTFFTNPRARYVMTDGGAATIGDRPTRIVALVPKAASSFTRARIWVDTETGVLRQFEADEQSGIRRLVTITAFTANATVSPNAFSFKPPKGTRVVDGSALR